MGRPEFVAVGPGFAIGCDELQHGPGLPAQDACAAGLYARFTQLSAIRAPAISPSGSAAPRIAGCIVLFKSLTIEASVRPVGSFHGVR